MEGQTWKEKKLNNKNNANDGEDNSDQDETSGHGSGLISVKFEEHEKHNKAQTSTGKRSLGSASGGGGSSVAPSCQADRCGVDLGEAKIYHRRHKVCEFHSKAAVVVVCGARQRFCQQCSRFHEVGEFDDTKRSCRRRLAGHNERRRKSAGEPYGEGSSSRRGSIGHSTPPATPKYQMATAAPARKPC